MTSLIFLLLFIAMLLALKDKANLSLSLFGIAIVLGLFWFRHHATSVLPIQL